MKNLKLVQRGYYVMALVLFTGLFLFSSCKKNDDNIVETPVAGLMAFNLSPDLSAIGVALSGSILTNSPLGFTNFTGAYQRIFTGERTVQSYGFNTQTTIATSPGNFEKDKYYSLFVVGANETFSHVLVRDNFDSLNNTAGEAYVRYINAVPDSADIDVTLSTGGSNIVSETAAFKSVSEFTAVSPGELNVVIHNGDGVSANRPISLAANKIYTILLVGISGATDPEKAIQIRFIENGTLAGS